MGRFIPFQCLYYQFKVNNPQNLLIGIYTAIVCKHVYSYRLIVYVQYSIPATRKRWVHVSDTRILIMQGFQGCCRQCTLFTLMILGAPGTIFTKFLQAHYLHVLVIDFWRVTVDYSSVTYQMEWGQCFPG